MLAGSPSTAQRFTAPKLSGFGFQALTPADLDGMTPPPAGSPNFIMRHVDTEAHGIAGYPSNDLLEVWAFSVNWVTPANSTFTKIADILTAEFDSTLCGLTSFYCMGMPGVAQGATNSLDPLREVIMQRLAYRNFGTHQVLVGNLVTDIGSNIGGIRWFELRKTGAGAWTLYQEGTYAPTAQDNRWMGGIAMDGAGNIALGYNISSQTIYPSLRYTGRLASDPLGTMPQGEYTLVSGTANNGSNRYGDYAAMSIDPIDDCTFWFTGEWNDNSQWKTRIGAFRFDACGSTNFTLNVTPESQQVCSPDNAQYSIALAGVGNFDGSVTLSAVGSPGSSSFNPNPATPPENSLLTISGAPVGQYSFEIYGTSTITATLVQSKTVSLEVVGMQPGTPVLLTPINAASNVPTTPTFTWEALPGAGTYAIQVATDLSFTNVVAQASGLANPIWTSNTALNTNATYFWRVRAENACGAGVYSDVRIFGTVAAPGDCAAGTSPNILYDYGFESGADGWTSSGTGNTWALSALNPYAGTTHFRGIGSATVSDQRLDSPLVALPAGENPVVLKFWHAPNLEPRTGGCYDGGILEVSNNGGSTWSQVPNSSLLLGGYTGPISASSNPLNGLNAWCGTNPQPYFQTIADLSSYAGQTVQFRMRIGTDSSVSRPGWDVDNVTVQSCQAAANNPSIELVKTVGTDRSSCADETSINVPSGTEVTYCYTVQNTGDVPLNIHTLEDSELGVLLSDFIYSLAPGASAAITETAVIDTDTVNTAVWTAYNIGPSNTTTATAFASVSVVNPSIALKTTVGTQAGVCAETEAISVDAGTEVFYCYSVENTGDTPLPLHDLQDDQLGWIFTELSYLLEPGESVNTVDAGLEISAVISTPTTNTATWTAYDGEMISVSASASAAVTVNPSITLNVTVGKEVDVCATTTEITVPAGTSVYYCYTVENTSPVAFSYHTLEDTVLGTIFEDLSYYLGPWGTVVSIRPVTLTNTTASTATWTAYTGGGQAASATASASATVSVIGTATENLLYLPIIRR
jgi:hypothetical protein